VGVVARGFDQAKFQRDVRAAARKVQSEVDRVNRENQRRVDAYNRQVAQRNQKVVNDYNREVARVNDHNRRVSSRNAQTIRQLNQALRSSSTSGPRYTADELALADRLREAVAAPSAEREWDSFLSYARIDGAVVGAELREYLEALSVSVWFDEVAIVPGRSQALQMDKGLRAARCGIVLLTPAYLAGRFWTERELGALLSKSTLIPVLHGVTWDDVKEYSGILPDLAGFETERDSTQSIAQKIAAAILPVEDEV